MSSFENLFGADGDRVAPGPFAAGPFANLHGGAAAAIMATRALEEAPEGFVPVSLRAEFLRSTPLAPFDVEVKPACLGRRHHIYDVAIFDIDSEKMTARSSVTFYKPVPTDLIEERVEDPWGGHTDPNKLMTLPDRPSPSGSDAWMIAATDVRTDLNGVYWFRWRGPIRGDDWSHWFPRLLGPADWVGGFISPSFPVPNEIGVWPNTDLTVHTDRPLSGEWIGVRPRGDYRATGYGLGHAQLIDEKGVFGHALASTISPLRKKAVLKDV